MPTATIELGDAVMQFVADSNRPTTWHIQRTDTNASLCGATTLGGVMSRRLIAQERVCADCLQSVGGAHLAAVRFSDYGTERGQLW